MEPFQIIVLVAVILVIIFCFFIVLHRIQHQKMKNTIFDRFQEISSLVKVMPRNSSYDYEVIDDNFNYLIKVISMSKNEELIITNPKFWCINADLKGWKRSTKPNLVSKVSEFMSLPTNEKTKRVALIYPDCYQRIVYLNESDVAFITKEKPIHGVYFITFSEIKSFFKR